MRDDWALGSFMVVGFAFFLLIQLSWRVGRRAKNLPSLPEGERGGRMGRWRQRSLLVVSLPLPLLLLTFGCWCLLTDCVAIAVAAAGSTTSVALLSHFSSLSPSLTLLFCSTLFFKLIPPPFLFACCCTQDNVLYGEEGRRDRINSQALATS